MNRCYTNVRFKPRQRMMSGSSTDPFPRTFSAVSRMSKFAGAMERSCTFGTSSEA